MVNHEILGGLRSALERGESLKRAMTTLFNAGYKREEIEEAARSLASNPVEVRNELLSVPTPSETIPSPSKPQKDLPVKEKKALLEKMKNPNPLKSISKPAVQQPVITIPSSGFAIGQDQSNFQPIQIISSYGEEKPIDKMIVFILIFLLIFLIGLLATIFIFKQELINLFSSMFAGT